MPFSSREWRFELIQNATLKCGKIVLHDDDEFFNIGHTTLNDNENELLSGHMSETEYNKAIINITNNTSPGSDDISVEFYKLFAKDIKQFYINSINYSYTTGS